MEEPDYLALVERYRHLPDEDLLRLVDRRAELLPAAQLAIDQEADRRKSALQALRRTRSEVKGGDDIRLERQVLKADAVNRSIRCPKCDAEMKEGFILDAAHAGKLVSRWVSGRPEESLWGGTAIKGREQYFIQSFRCGACGYLESYAAES
jgi:hypothetical protein